MKITMHENGWTPIVTDFDMKTATQVDINTIAKLECTYSVVVIKHQQLSVEDELRIANMFGAVEEFPAIDFLKGKAVTGGNNSVLRVTGKPDENGDLGLWPDKQELEWHANNPSDPNRHDNIWLYGVEGTAGSRTSYANTKLAYEAMTDEDKEKYSGLRTYVRTEVPFRNVGEVDLRLKDYPLVMKNAMGYEGIFFPYGQVVEVFQENRVNSSRREKMKLLIGLRRYITEERFVYHHDWEDGDLVLADQWLGIHKRWEFEHMDKRVLHRIATHFNNIDFT